MNSSLTHRLNCCADAYPCPGYPDSQSRPTFRLHFSLLDLGKPVDGDSRRGARRSPVASCCYTLFCCRGPAAQCGFVAEEKVAAEQTRVECPPVTERYHHGGPVRTAVLGRAVCCVFHDGHFLFSRADGCGCAHAIDHPTQSAAQRRLCNAGCVWRNTLSFLRRPDFYRTGNARWSGCSVFYDAKLLVGGVCQAETSRYSLCRSHGITTVVRLCCSILGNVGLGIASACRVDKDCASGDGLPD